MCTTFVNYIEAVQTLALNPDERYYIKLKAAYLYYYEDLTQKKVAERLHVSRPTLNKLLKEARQEGMVKIEIHDYRNYSYLVEMENELCAKLGLTDVKVARCYTDEPSIVIERIGKAAAVYIDKTIRGGMCVGVGWGRTLESIANYITPNSNVMNCEFVTLVGGAGNLEFQLHANGLTERIAHNYHHSTAHHIYAPIFSVDATLSSALLKDAHIKKVMNKMNDLDFALVGVDGDLSASTTLMTNSFPREYLDKLAQEKAVGNICARFYDIDGKPCAHELNERVISIPLKLLKKTPQVIAVAAGNHKVASIIGGARGGFFDILVTDEHTAKALLAYK